MSDLGKIYGIEGLVNNTTPNVRERLAGKYQFNVIDYEVFRVRVTILKLILII